MASLGLDQHHLIVFGVNLARLCIWLVLLSAIFVPLERLFALHQQSIFRRGVLVDLGYFFLSGLLPALLLSLPLGVMAAVVYRMLPAEYLALVGQMPLWGRVVCGLLVAEIGSYWGHRLSHTVPFLWRFHAVHHSAEQIDFLVNTRAHPIDLVFTRLCGLAPLYALGLASPVGPDAGLVPVIVTLIGTVWSFFIHANLRWRFGPLEQLVSTPAFHHWHHTRHDHRDRNYAATFPWVDRIFGSFYLPREWPAEYGTDTPVGASLPRQLVQPFMPAAVARSDAAVAQGVRASAN